MSSLSYPVLTNFSLRRIISVKRVGKLCHTSPYPMNTTENPVIAHSRLRNGVKNNMIQYDRSSVGPYITLGVSLLTLYDPGTTSCLHVKGLQTPTRQRPYIRETMHSALNL